MTEQNFKWDACVLGNGVSSLWLAHWLWTNKKSVIWVTSEEVYSASRAMLQHGWLWDVKPEHSQWLQTELQGFDADGAGQAFEAIYYEAKTTRRFHRLHDWPVEWGVHEAEVMKSILPPTSSVNSEVKDTPPADLWKWHSRLHAFHDTGSSQLPSRLELFSEPRFVRVQGWPLLEIKTEEGKIQSLVLAQQGEITAQEYYLGDYDEHLPSLIKNESDSQALAAALKGRSFRAGFGLRLWHKPEFQQVPVQNTIVPLLVSPEKGMGSHVTGRFIQAPATEAGAGALESCWIGFLTDEELEDNNEILKKIKQAKRAVDRAIPGFSESIEREAVTFELKMRGVELLKKRAHSALGAKLFTDQMGSNYAASLLRHQLAGAELDEPARAEKAPKKASHKGSAKASKSKNSSDQNAENPVQAT